MKLFDLNAKKEIYQISNQSFSFFVTSQEIQQNITCFGVITIFAQIILLIIKVHKKLKKILSFQMGKIFSSCKCINPNRAKNFNKLESFKFQFDHDQFNNYTCNFINYWIASSKVFDSPTRTTLSPNNGKFKTNQLNLKNDNGKQFKEHQSKSNDYCLSTIIIFGQNDFATQLQFFINQFSKYNAILYNPSKKKKLKKAKAVIGIVTNTPSETKEIYFWKYCYQIFIFQFHGQNEFLFRIPHKFAHESIFILNAMDDAIEEIGDKYSEFHNSETINILNHKTLFEKYFSSNDQIKNYILCLILATFFTVTKTENIQKIRIPSIDLIVKFGDPQNNKQSIQIQCRNSDFNFDRLQLTESLKNNILAPILGFQKICYSPRQRQMIFYGINNLGLTWYVNTSLQLIKRMTLMWNNSKLKPDQNKQLYTFLWSQHNDKQNNEALVKAVIRDCGDSDRQGTNYAGDITKVIPNFLNKNKSENIVDQKYFLLQVHYEYICKNRMCTQRDKGTDNIIHLNPNYIVLKESSTKLEECINKTIGEKEELECLSCKSSYEKKINHVNFPIYLFVNVQQWKGELQFQISLKSPCSSDSTKYTYKLVGVAIYTAYNYYCYVKGIDNDSWECLDDDKCNKSLLSDITSNPNKFLCLYEMI